jgi:hypothetical protein
VYFINFEGHLSSHSKPAPVRDPAPVQVSHARQELPEQTLRVLAGDPAALHDELEQLPPWGVLAHHEHVRGGVDHFEHFHHVGVRAAFQQANFSHHLVKAKIKN